MGSEMCIRDSPKLTAMLQSERYLNYWNACYYLGVWGCNANQMEERAVVYPKEIYAGEDSPIWTDIERWNKEYERKQRDAEQERLREREYTKKLEQECQECRTMLDECQTCVSDLERQKNEADDARKQAELEKQGLVSQVAAAKEYAGEWEQKCQEYQKTLEDHQKQLRELETAYQTEISELNHKLHVAQIDNERTSNLLKIAEDEKARLWGRIGHIQWQLDNSWNECNQIRGEYNEFQIVKGSRSYHVIQRWWEFRNKIRRLFRRK